MINNTRRFASATYARLVLMPGNFSLRREMRVFHGERFIDHPARPPAAIERVACTLINFPLCFLRLACMQGDVSSAMVDAGTNTSP